MNKLLLVSMLVLLCMANVNATRFLEDAIAKDETETVNPLAEETVVDGKQEQNPTVDEQEKTDNKSTESPKTQDNEAPIEDKKEPTTETKEVIPTVAEEKPEVKEEGEEQKKEEKEEEQPNIAPLKEEDKKSSYFGLSFGFILFLAAGVLFFFVGFYRYSLRKYKIPPFTPPTFCPNFLFPRPENDLLMEDYCIQSGATEMGGVYSSEKYHNFY